MCIAKGSFILLNMLLVAGMVVDEREEWEEEDDAVPSD